MCSIFFTSKRVTPLDYAVCGALQQLIKPENSRHCALKGSVTQLLGQRLDWRRNRPVVKTYYNGHSGRHTEHWLKWYGTLTNSNIASNLLFWT